MLVGGGEWGSSWGSLWGSVRSLGAGINKGTPRRVAVEAPGVEVVKGNSGVRRGWQ